MPASRSVAVTPVTRSPSRRNPVTLTRVATWAPWVAAVRATIMVWRASSTCASQYCTAPVSASGRRSGTTRRALRLDRCRWIGTPRGYGDAAASES